MLVASILSPLRAADRDESASTVNPLAQKEAMIRERFQRFEDRLFRLREDLSEAEPANAERLERVLERAGELGLGDKLDEIVRLLSTPSNAYEANDAQIAWMQEAENLLAILLERDGENDARKDEIARLQEYRKELDKILQEQRSHRQASGRAAAAKQMSEQLDQAIRRLDALQKAQGELSAKSPKTTSEPSAESGKLGDQEQDLAKDAERLAEDLSRLSELKPDASADSSALDAARQAAKSASQSTQSGAKSMSDAGEGLKAGKSPQGEQKSAEEALKKAREELEAAKKALAPESKTSGSEQKATAQKTGGLSEKMQKESSEGSPGSKGKGGKGGKGKSGAQGQKSPPGAPQLDQAQKEMDDAGESLDESDPDKAVPPQDRALEQLEQAERELDEALNQVRKEERAETLRDLEHRFRDMLAKQRVVNEGTTVLDQVGESNFTRAEKLRAAELATNQRTLAGDAAGCLHVLEEDATTIVFPRVVDQLVEDMGAAADRLASLKVGAVTQQIEAEIVQTLEELLQAVQKMQQENEQGAGKPGKSGDDENQPLLPTSAELKLLRASQLRVNTRTTAIVESVSAGSESPDGGEAGLRAIANRQKECADIAKEIRDRAEVQ